MYGIKGGGVTLGLSKVGGDTEHIQIFTNI